MSAEQLYTFGPFVLDPARRLLVRDGESIPLTPKAFDTLVILVERREQVMSKEELLQLLWPDVVVEESNLSQQISHLRKALDDEASEPRYIVTLPKRGYRFVAAVTEKDSVSGKRAVPILVAQPRFLLAVLVVVALAAVVAAAIVFRPQPPQADLVRFAIDPPPGARFSFLALSPDGGQLVFSVRDAHGEDQLWVRPLEALESRVLAGTEGGVLPFWSPDGRHVGFFAHGKLKTIDVLGGPPEALCDAPNPRGGSWSRAGVIVFAPDSRSALLRISATGGSPTPVTYLDPAIRAMLPLRGEAGGQMPQIVQKWPSGPEFLHTLRRSRRGHRTLGPGGITTHHQGRERESDIDGRGGPAATAWVQDGVHGVGQLLSPRTADLKNKKDAYVAIASANETPARTALFCRRVTLPAEDVRVCSDYSSAERIVPTKVRTLARLVLLGAFCLSGTGAPASAAQRRQLPSAAGGEHLRMNVTGAGLCSSSTAPVAGSTVQSPDGRSHDARNARPNTAPAARRRPGPPVRDTPAASRRHDV